jgi:hypothetical protein
MLFWLLGYFVVVQIGSLVLLLELALVHNPLTSQTARIIAVYYHARLFTQIKHHCLLPGLTLNCYFSISSPKY